MIGDPVIDDDDDDDSQVLKGQSISLSPTGCIHLYILRDSSVGGHPVCELVYAGNTRVTGHRLGRPQADEEQTGNEKACQLF